MSFGNIDVINSWKCLNFINSKNASVIVAVVEKVIGIKTYQMFGCFKFRFQVDYLGYGKMGKTMTKARIYHVKEPNLMRRVSWL